MNPSGTPSRLGASTLVLAGALSIVLIIVACSVRDRPAARPAATPQASVQTPTAPGAVSPDRPRPAGPAKEETVAELRRRIEDRGSDYSSRIEARRALIQRLRRQGQLDGMAAELLALLDDVQVHEDPEMAQRVALSEAATLQVAQVPEAALRAYELLVQRYPDGRFLPEALYRQGECRLELRDYAGAGRVWSELIEGHGDSPWAAEGWRKRALAELLLGRSDDSLATLGRMAQRYPGTEFEEYADMRRGYVLMAAGRTDEAREAYQEFLGRCPSSRYCRLVHKQLGELETVRPLAQAARGMRKQ